MNDKFDVNESPNAELLTVLAVARRSTSAYVVPVLQETSLPNVIEIKPEQVRAVKVKSIMNNVSGKSASLKPTPSSWSPTFLGWFGWLAILFSVASSLYLLNRDAMSKGLLQTTPRTLASTNENVADEVLETPLVSDVPPKLETPENNANTELGLIDVNAIEPSAPSSLQIYRKKIADIKIGERTVGTNPQGANPAESNAAIFERFKHYGYKLCYLKENGTQCSINLLRPEDWLDYEIIQLRRKIDDKVLDELDCQLMAMAPYHFDDSVAYDVEIWLELPEMGVIGWAKLLEIDAEVKIQPGAGNVVTGTFAHVSDEVIDLQIEAQATRSAVRPTIRSGRLTVKILSKPDNCKRASASIFTTAKPNASSKSCRVRVRKTSIISKSISSTCTKLRSTARWCTICVHQ